MHYRGKLYRALNPVYAREPLSGRGAELYGGRFNAKGVPAVYCSLAIATALKEANRVGTLQPTTIVAYEAEIGEIFDSRDPALLAAHGIDAAGLADPDWRDRVKIHGQSPTQDFSGRLVIAGYRGLLVRSFAPGAGAEDLNLVLWHWNTGAGSSLRLIDDEGRLSHLR